MRLNKFFVGEILIEEFLTQARGWRDFVTRTYGKMLGGREVLVQENPDFVEEPQLLGRHE